MIENVDNAARTENTSAANSDAPIATDDSYALLKDNTLTVEAPGLLSNDVDPNDEAVTGTMLVRDVSNGTLTLFKNGSFMYVPNRGFTGTDDFTYTIVNASGLSSDAGTVYLEIVSPTDRRPIAVNDTYTVFAGTSLSVDPPGFLANDIDPNDEKIVATDLIQDVEHGTLSASFNGRFTYTPDDGFTGTDHFKYAVGNTSGFISEPAIVTLNVISTNEPPVANAGADQVIECSGTKGQIVTLNGTNSNDPDGDGLTFTWLNGTTVVAGPAASAIADISLSPGAYTFTLRVSDGELTDTDEVQVIVQDTTPPVIDLVGDSEIVLECGVDTYNEPGATVTDICDASTVVAISGTVNTSTPGTYTITYTATDGHGNNAVPVERTVRVVDTTPPVVTVHSAPTSLWPPNHKYRTITLADLNITVEDHCDKEISAENVVIVSVSSDEPENAGSGGDGNTENDIVLNNTCRSVDLRSERLGSSDGRVYTLYLEATDASGNTGFATYEVHVPHDKASGPLAVGGAALYTITSTTCTPTEASSKIAEEASTSENATDGYSLGANYPNPVSTQTNIKFVLPVGDDVSLRIYNLYGEVVDILVDDYREAGEYEVAFDASKLENGIYIYHLESGTFSATGRMIVVE